LMQSKVDGQSRTNVHSSEVFPDPLLLGYGYGLRKQYVSEMPDLHLRFYQFSNLLTLHLPEVASHLIGLRITPMLYANEWFLTLFTYTFPEKEVVQIFDLFFLEGLPVLFRIGLAIMSLLKPKLIKCGLEGCLRLLKDIGNRKSARLHQPGKYVLGVKEVIEMAQTINVTPQHLEKMESRLSSCLEEFKVLIEYTMPRLAKFLFVTQKINCQHFALDWYANCFQTILDEQDARAAAEVYQSVYEVREVDTTTTESEDITSSSSSSSSSFSSEPSRDEKSWTDILLNGLKSDGNRNELAAGFNAKEGPKLARWVLHGVALAILETKAETLLSQDTRDKTLRWCKTRLRLAWNDEEGMKIEDLLARAKFLVSKDLASIRQTMM